MPRFIRPLSTALAITLVAACGGGDDGGARDGAGLVACISDFGVWVRSGDGTQLTKISDGVNGDTDVSWSPDGKRIALAEYGTHALSVVNADGTGRTELVSDDPSITEADWSPDGAHIAFRRHADPERTVRVISADGSEERPVAEGFFAAWSADGSAIIYFAPYLPYYEPLPEPSSLFAREVRMGAEPRKLRELPPLSEFTVSSDGRQIAYVSKDGLFLVDTEGGGEPRQLLPADAIYGPLAFSPDGTRLSFVGTERTGQFSVAEYLEVIETDGTNRRRISRDLAADPSLTFAAWSPDGLLIVYPLYDGGPEPRLVAADPDGPEDQTPAEFENCPGIPEWQPLTAE